MVAHTAFHSKDPLVLWNYENDMILKDSEVDELMNGDCMQYKNYDDQSRGQYQGHYNGSNLVNTLDAPCQVSHSVNLSTNCFYLLIFFVW